MTRDEFIGTVAPVVVKVRVDGGVLFPSVSVAQALLETGGRIPSSNNIVGYKVGSGRRTPYWQGRSVTSQTWEVIDGVRYDNVPANWRAYDSIEDSLKDQALLFLNNRARYQRVVDARTPQEQATMLQESGYATDPQYANKIISIMNRDNLQRFDQEAERAMERLAELESQIRQMKSEIIELQHKHEQAVPGWAREAVDAAVRAGYVDTPEGGSQDFYRFVTVMYRAGVFDQA